MSPIMIPPRLDEGSEREAYPPLPDPYTVEYDDIDKEEVKCFAEGQMRAYVDADRASRAALSTGRIGGEVDGRCNNCDDTGDVHSFDGEWRGICHCSAGDAIRARAPEAQPQGDKSHG